MMSKFGRAVFAGMMASLLLTGHVQAAPALVTTDGRFLSARNPIATADQRDLEALAIRLWNTDAVKVARQKVKAQWRAAVRNGPPPEQWAMFDATADEYVFHFCMKAANSDPNYPKVLQVMSPPHEWFGMRVPGSRWGGDNPDNSYRIIPMDGAARYEIQGQRFQNAVTNHTFHLVGDYSTSQTLGLIESRDLKVGNDGKFTITIDPEPAKGRPNHIQSKPRALYLFVRDSRGDWRQMPNALTVKRLDPPTAPPLTEQEMAERAAEIMIDELPLTFWWNNLVGDVMLGPIRSVEHGGIPSQVISAINVRLNDDEAIVVNVNPAGAAYRAIILNQAWGISLDYPNRLNSINSSQEARNRDGTVTYVLSIKDPGVYNWLDPQGLHEVKVYYRWRELPRDQADTSVSDWWNLKTVKLKDLPSVLPKNTRMVTPAEREEQLADRLASYKIRLVDH